ncbi:hypothetical protein Lbir_2390 [Legionella birminghamensis]|uniref:Uncharacterized protein n=1 Tax=Legionella birminghamensis TaxID=28083 RepID=A0A378IFB9_9GAMM|nr:hypothetical protein [Legionella birminghamensis]KTC68857.1 hypothetical protein Lbir_2390 [Legionella birminghamensis]STX33201.1 Uncharacterised protein [Legionella birminghamensis]
MIYKLLIQYFRLHLLRLFLNKVIKPKGINRGKLHPVNLAAIALELLLTVWASGKKKS